MLKNSLHSRSRKATSLLHNHRVLRISLLCDSSAVASSCLGLFLAVGLLLHGLHATLVRLALLVRLVVGLGLVEFGALDAVEVAVGREFFKDLSLVELLQVTLVVQVGVDLVEVARVTAGLLLGVDTTDIRVSMYLDLDISFSM
jgi:hypothetical protein